MGPFAFLFAWYNAPFLVALACCLIFAAMQIVAGMGDNDADADGPDGPDADADVDADADADADGPDADGPDGPDAGGFDLLSALGIGRVPLMLVLIALLGTLGAFGLILNALLIRVLNLGPAVGLPVALLGGGALAFFATGRLSRLLGRFAGNVSTAVTFEQLVGRPGVVVSPRVTATYGQVAVRDAHGTLHTVFAIAPSGEPIPRQTEVALLAYDEDRQRFTVKALQKL